MAERVAIAGAGRMGVPMAQVLAAAGFQVDLADWRERGDGGAGVWARARAEIGANAGLLVQEGLAGPEYLAQVLGRISFHHGPGDYLAAADCVFDALPERLEAKEPLFRELGARTRPDCLVGSTTSTFAPDLLAASLPGPERFMVTHWLNPAFIMPLVEVAPGTATAPAHLDRMLDLLRRARKVPVVCAGRPGFIVPRLQTVLMNEAARMADEGVATPAELDRAVRLGMGFRYLVLGPLEFTDFGGLDTLYYAGSYLGQALDDPKFTPPPGVAARMERGEIGQKTGQGFYDWGAPEMQDFARERQRRYLHLLRFLGLL